MNNSVVASSERTGKSTCGFATRNQLRHWIKKIHQALISTSKLKTQINKMIGHCFNPQLARGRVQSSDWLAWLSIRIKHILNIAFMQFPTSEFHFVRLITILSFKICSLFISVIWSLYLQQFCFSSCDFAYIIDISCSVTSIQCCLIMLNKAFYSQVHVGVHVRY